MGLKKDFGIRLKELRKSKGWTQEKLAETVGVDTKHISFLETGRNFPSADLLEKIKNTFDVDYRDIFDIETCNKQKYYERINNLLSNMNEKEMRFIYKVILEYANI